jgi:hypothetical protein
MTGLSPFLRLPAMPTSDPIRIFCGGDRSQQLPFKVLVHSIKRHTAREVDIQPLDNAVVPLPENPQHAPYTEFSFARFAIPALCHHSGRAIYMDSDMLVFADIGELWDTPMQGAKIAIEIGSRQQADKGKHAAVMLLDCAALDWKVERIVAGLGRDYEYKELMQIDPLLEPGQMRELIPSGWNDLDHYEAGRTRNLHFTKIRTQPWVFAAHPHGQLWIDEVRMMLDAGELDEAELEEEVRLGYLRPSLLPQLGLGAEGIRLREANVQSQLKPDLLLAYDNASGFIAHRKLIARAAERKRAIARFRCEQASARHPWLGPWHRLVYRLRYGA